MPKIYLAVEHVNETKNKIINLSHRVQSLENEISRSINRLDWEVSQKQLIREQISLAKTKANQVAHKSNLLGSFAQKAINDFTAADLRCANQQKELNKTMDKIWKGLMWLDSKIHAAVKTTITSILNFIKQAEVIFLNRMNQLKTTNLNIIYSAMGFLAVGTAKISPIQLPESIKKRLEILPFKPTPASGPSPITPQQTPTNEQIPPFNGMLSHNPSVRSKDVELMQQRLHDLGYDVIVDGYFGPNTLKAVNDFKRNNNLDNYGEYEGKIGATSWPVLFSAAAVGMTNSKTEEGINANNGFSDSMIYPPTMISWQDFNREYPIGTVVTITDANDPSISYKAVRWGGKNHGDFLPMTEQDRQILQEKMYSGKAWEPRKGIIVTVTNKDGTTKSFAAAQHGMPHLTGNSDTGDKFDLGVDVPPGGVYPGTKRNPYHFCIYFWGSKGHGNPSYREDYSIETLKAAQIPENLWPEKLKELGLKRKK